MIPRPRYFHGTDVDIPVGGELKPASEVPQSRKWDYENGMFPPGHGGHVYAVRAGESRWRDPSFPVAGGPKMRNLLAENDEQRHLIPKAEERAYAWGRSGVRNRSWRNDAPPFSPDMGRVRIYEVEPKGEVSPDPVGGSGEIWPNTESPVRMPRGRVTGVQWTRPPEPSETGVQGTLPPINWNFYHKYARERQGNSSDLNQHGLRPIEPLPSTPEVLEHAPQFHAIIPGQMKLPFGNS